MAIIASLCNSVWLVIKHRNKGAVPHSRLTQLQGVLPFFIFPCMPTVKGQLHKTNQKKGGGCLLQVQGGQSGWESRRPHLPLIPPIWRCARVLSCSLRYSHFKPPPLFLSLSLSVAGSYGEKWLDVFQLHDCKSLHLPHTWACEGNQRQWKVGQCRAGAAWCHHGFSLGSSFPFISPLEGCTRSASEWGPLFCNIHCAVKLFFFVQWLLQIYC